MATGEMSGYAEYMKQVRADATIINDSLTDREQDLQQHETHLSAREALIHDAVTKVQALLSRCDSIIADAEKRKADAERERQEQEEEPPPGIADFTPEPTGELHDLPPKSEASEIPTDPPEEDAPPDDDEPQMLQRAPAPTQDPTEPMIPSTVSQE
jgi:hypothetical protein